MKSGSGSVSASASSTMMFTEMKTMMLTVMKTLTEMEFKCHLNHDVKLNETMIVN